MFETGEVRANECKSKRQVRRLNRDISSSIFFKIKVCCVFSLELPHQYKKKIILNYPKSAAMRFCSKGHKKEFETAVVNTPSVFEPLKFYCILNCKGGMECTSP